MAHTNIETEYPELLIVPSLFHPLLPGTSETGRISRRWQGSITFSFPLRCPLVTVRPSSSRRYSMDRKQIPVAILGTHYLLRTTMMMMRDRKDEGRQKAMGQNGNKDFGSFIGQRRITVGKLLRFLSSIFQMNFFFLSSHVNDPNDGASFNLRGAFKEEGRRIK